MKAEKLVSFSVRLHKTGGVLPQLVKNINRVVFGCDVSFDISLGNNFKLPHQGLGVVIGPKVVIGENVTIYQNVTLGAKVNGTGYTAPEIGNNVIIGAGACILGKVKIGNNVIIGANAVVLSDIPENGIAVGVPAKIIRREKEK